MMMMDTRLLKKAISILQLDKVVGNIVDLKEIVDEVYSSAKEEMNFMVEAEHIEEFENYNKNVMYIRPLKVYKKYSTPYILVMECVGGCFINEKSKLDRLGYNMNEIALKLADNYIKQAIDDGFFHADPHADNIKIIDGKIAYLDFGMMGRLSSKNKNLLNKCIVAIIKNDIVEVAHILSLLNVNDSNIDYMKLNSDIRMVLDKNKTLEINDIDIKDFMKDMFSMLHNNDIKLPKDISMLVRGIVVLEGTLEEIDSTISLMQVLKNRFNTSKIMTKEKIESGLVKILENSDSLVSMPKEMLTTLKGINNGELRFNIEINDSKNQVNRFEELFHQGVVGYYFAYAVLVLVSSARTARAGQKKQALLQVRNLVLFGLMSMVAMLILLWPMVSRILAYSYAERYSYYNGGGFAAEISLQFWRMGLMNLVLVGMGLWFSLKKRKMPALPCLAGLEILLSMLLFTRIQNTGSHQMLLFLPGWFLLFLLGAAALAEGISRFRAAKVVFWVFTLVFATSVRCSPLTTIALPGFLVDHFPLAVTEEFVRLDKLIYDRKDLPQIKAIANWIDTHCAEGEISYMIPHDMLYCPDHFKNCQLPATPINDKLAFGFSVPGTHNFPMQFFEAKYVLTADPFPQTFVGNGEMSHKLNERFLAVRDEYFALEATFDMGNGTTFTIWRRTVAPTRAEVEYYLSAFKEEDAQYPEMFSQIAESWLAARGL